MGIWLQFTRLKNMTKSLKFWTSLHPLSIIFWTSLHPPKFVCFLAVNKLICMSIRVNQSQEVFKVIFAFQNWSRCNKILQKWSKMAQFGENVIYQYIYMEIKGLGCPFLVLLPNFQPHLGWIYHFSTSKVIRYPSVFSQSSKIVWKWPKLVEKLSVYMEILGPGCAFLSYSPIFSPAELMCNTLRHLKWFGIPKLIA